MATLHMHADGLHADADKYKERRKKNLHVRPEFIACGVEQTLQLSAY